MHDAPLATADAHAATASYQQLPRRQLIFTMAGLLLALLLSALDQTIVGTAMPRVVSELQGFDHYAWVTTAYLLTSTAVVPIVGKLGDLYGRKMFLVGGATFFVLTSALCGLAQDMTQLIVFRGLQGLAGGVLTATVFTVISALFPPARRGKVQGWFGGVFGLASIVGPLVGGYLTDNLSWRWVFYVNLPVGLFALAVLWLAFPNIRPNRGDARIDYLGALTLVAGVVPLLLALSWGGREYAWASAQILGLFALAAAMLVAFGFAEARAEEPIMPLSLFRNRIVGTATLALTLFAIAMFGTILFVPLFIQAVIGSSATQSGTALTPMMFAMILSSVAAGQIISRTGRYRLVGLLGMGTMAVGMLLLSGMGVDTDYPTVVRNMVILGLGLGPTMPVFTLASQNAVGLSQLGVVTSFTQFARSIGGTVGAAVFGSLLVNRFGPALQVALPPRLAASLPPERLAQLQNPQALLNPEAASALRAGFAQASPQGTATFESLLQAIKVALATSLHDMFLVGAAIVAVGTAVVLFLPEIPLKSSAGRGRPPAPASVAPAPTLAGLAATEQALADGALPSLPPLRPSDEPAARAGAEAAAAAEPALAASPRRQR